MRRLCPQRRRAKAKDNLLADSLRPCPMLRSQARQCRRRRRRAGKTSGNTGAHPRTAAHPEGREQPQLSVLESGVDLLASVAIKDKATRQTIDHYGGEILTTAALFAGGKVGL